MNAQFPMLPGHGYVVCMNCGTLQEVAPTDDGYPAGRGQYRKTCPDCRMSTWYDVASGIPTVCNVAGCGLDVVPGMSVCSEHWQATCKEALERTLRNSHSRR